MFRTVAVALPILDDIAVSMKLTGWAKKVSH